MRKVFLRSVVITLILQISGIFSLIPFFSWVLHYDSVTAQSPSIPIYSVHRDAGWWEAITATAQTLSWDTAVAINSEILINGANNSFDLSAWGHYLVMYSIPVQSTSWFNRSEIQSWLELNSSTAIPYSYSSAYIRRVDGDFEWYLEGSAVIEAAAGDDIDVKIQRSNTNTSWVSRSANRSGINILKLDDSWDYARLRPASAQGITTSWENVNVSVSDELDTAWYSLSWNDVTLTQTGKYLVSYNVWAITTGSDRTNNEVRLILDGAEIDATRSTAYVRAQEGSFTGISSFVWIIETSSINQVLNLQIRRESTLAGTTNNTIPSKSWLTITKLPDSADYVRVWESGGGQDISNIASALSFDTTIEQGSSLQHDAVVNSQIQVQSAGDFLMLHSIYNTRTGTSNLSRENPYLRWRVGWNDVGYGTSWSYNRHSNDADGITSSSASSAWVILSWVWAGDIIELIQQNEASNGEAVYEAERMGIQWVNLLSLFSSDGFLSQWEYRFRDDSSDFDDNAWWLAPENTDISNISKNQTIRWRTKIENTSWQNYNTASRFELQWAETVWSCSSWLSWNSISSLGDAWEMVDTPNISPNAETSLAQLLSNPWGNTHIRSEWYHNSDGETLLTGSWIFIDDSQKEYEFSMRATNSAISNQSYCFRLFDTENISALPVNNYGKIQLWSTPVVLDDVWGEAWSIQAPANGWWTTVTYAGWPYTSPVIVGRTNTHNDPAEALVFEARNVGPTSAQVRLCDSNAWNASWCQAHAVETIWYIVVDASQTSSIDGIEAGTFTANESFDTAGWSITTSYVESFSTTPYVFTSIQTTNGLGPVVTRVSASNASWFTGWICRQNSQDACDGANGNETFWWIAVDPSVNPFLTQMDIGALPAEPFSGTWVSAAFSTSFSSIPIGLIQAVTNNWWQDVQIDEVQNVTLSGMEIRSCELDNDDDCDTHNSDTLVWLAIEEWIFASEYLLDKTHYRWYENNGANTPIVALTNENTTLSNLPTNEQLRLRMLLQNGDPELPAGVLSLRLQYGEGNSCDTISTWTEVWSLWGWEDWLHFDNPWVTDGDTITNSLLFWGWHTLQSYNESLPTVVNPNPIPVGEWGEWDFSLVKNPLATADQYCFRVVTQANNEIEYSAYAKIDSSDIIAPSISSFSPASWSLLPIWNFELEYEYADAGSGIDTSNFDITLQRFESWSFWADISGAFASIDVLTTSWAVISITNLPFGRYQAWFEIYDNAWNKSFVIHEFYVDQPEFIISTPEVDIWTIDQSNTIFTSDDILNVTVKTIWAAFRVDMMQQTDLENMWNTIEDWDGSMWFWFTESPFSTTQAFGSWVTIIDQARNLNTNGEKNIYSFDVRYSVLLDILENYGAGDYESLLDFKIELDY